MNHDTVLNLNDELINRYAEKYERSQWRDALIVMAVAVLVFVAISGFPWN